MLENVFLRKEIVMEVEVNWKVPAKIIIHTLDIWGDAYSEQTLTQKHDQARVGQRAWGAREPLVSSRALQPPEFRGDRSCTGLTWHRAIWGSHQSSFVLPHLPMHSAVGIQHMDLKHPLLPDCFTLEPPLLSLPGHTCTNIAVFDGFNAFHTFTLVLTLFLFPIL